MKLEIVDRDAPTLARAFGVSHHREEMIDLIVTREYLRGSKQNDRPTDVLERIVREVNTPGELLLASLAYIANKEALAMTVRDSGASADQVIDVLTKSTKDKIEKLKNT